MSGPWEKYQSQAAPKPWEKYANEKPVTPYKFGDLQATLKEEMASRSGPERFLAGAGTFLDDASLRLKQLVAGLSPEDVSQAESNKTIKADPYGFAGNVVGGVGALGPLGVSSVAGNAALGAGVGALGAPVMEGESGAENAFTGAVAGGAGGVLGKLATGAPFIKPTDATKRLLKEGVVPTVGQNASSSSSGIKQFLGRVEERAASMPIIGDFITGSRRRALAEFNKAALSKAMPGGEVSKIGAEGVDDALRAVGGAYDEVYKGSKAGPSLQLMKDIADAKTKPLVKLSTDAEQKFDDLIQRFVLERLEPGMDAGVVKKTIEADLGKLARDFKMNPKHSDNYNLGVALQSARDAVRSALNRSVGGAKAAKLPELNRAYAAGKTLEDASERASAQGGIFTPHQLQRAAGEGPLRSLADDAQSVLASRVPNSGTADRALQALLATGQMQSTGTLGYLGGALATAPAYSRFGSRMLLGDLTPEQMQALAPYVAQAVRGGLYGQ